MPLFDWKTPQTYLRLKYAFWGSLLFCLASRFAGTWEIQLGRFGQPLYGKLLRVSYLIPWMQGILTILYTAAAAFLICDLLEIRDRWMVLVSAGLLFSSVRFSNEIYTFLQVQYDKTLTHVTRIMDDIDETPGYEYNETEIVCIGTLNYALQNLRQPEAYRWLRGTGGAAATTYHQTFLSFVHMMGEKMNISLDLEYARQMQKTPEVEAMPYYPRSGYCQMIGDQLVVKLSPWW